MWKNSRSTRVNPVVYQKKHFYYPSCGFFSSSAIKVKAFLCTRVGSGKKEGQEELLHFYYITFCLSLMDPRPSTAILVMVSSWRRFIEFPLGPRSFPTKLNWRKGRECHQEKHNRIISIFLYYLGMLPDGHQNPNGESDGSFTVNIHVFDGFTVAGGTGTSTGSSWLYSCNFCKRANNNPSFQSQHIFFFLSFRVLRSNVTFSPAWRDKGELWDNFHLSQFWPSGGGECAVLKKIS